MAYKDKAKQSEYYAAWCAANPEKTKAIHAKYRAENLEKEKKRDAKYRSANTEKIKTKDAKWYATHSDQVKARHLKWRTEHVEEEKARHAKYRSENPEKRSSDSAKRRALMAGVGGTFTASEWRDIVNKHDHTCVYCNKRFDRLTQDHVIPLSKGGRHEAANIVPACQSCNSKKGTKILEQT